MSRKIYVVGGDTRYANWMNGTIVETLDEAEMVVFTGGEDVHPDLYNEPVGARTYTNKKRDIFEQQMFKDAVAKNKKIIGICRGSQFTCVMSGGRLVQDQANPYYLHEIETIDGKKITITSTHHQAQFPYDMNEDDYTLIAWTNDISEYHLDGNNKEITDKFFREAEIVYYPKTDALAIQGHPEMIYAENSDEYKETFDYLNELLDNFLQNKLQYEQREVC